jgi:hypothetical protein
MMEGRLFVLCQVVYEKVVGGTPFCLEDDGNKEPVNFDVCPTSYASHPRRM